MRRKTICVLLTLLIIVCSALAVAAPPENKVVSDVNGDGVLEISNVTGEESGEFADGEECQVFYAVAPAKITLLADVKDSELGGIVLSVELTGDDWDFEIIDEVSVSEGDYDWGDEGSYTVPKGAVYLLDVGTYYLSAEEADMPIFIIVNAGEADATDPEGSEETEGVIVNVAARTITMTIGSTTVGQGRMLLPPPAVAPQIIGGRTMLPFRYLVQTVLGGEVNYVAEERRIEASVAGHDFVMVVDEPRILIDGEFYDYGQAPVIVDDFTLVPLRAFEVLFSEVIWDADTKVVMLVPTAELVMQQNIQYSITEQ
jgi:hypothetical protein